MESKIEVTDRLRREGRWDAACRFRDELKRRLQAEGRTRKEANEQAWQAMIAEFPPLPGDEPLDYADDELGEPANDGDTVDIVADLRWVYRTLGRKRVQPNDPPPGPGALGLLRWARANQTRFYDTLVPKLATRADEAEQEGEPESPTTVDELMARYLPIAGRDGDRTCCDSQ